MMPVPISPIRDALPATLRGADLALAFNLVSSRQEIRSALPISTANERLGSN